MAEGPVYIALGAVYVAGLLLAGIWSARHKGDSNQYLNATSALPLWVCATACIAANCGSVDLFAMMALGAQYGMMACHFYWIGAIPALLAVAFWLLPAYNRSRNPSILDFVGRHYGHATRSIVALCMAAMMMLIAGVSLCAVAQTVTVFLGWSFLQGVLVAAALVLFYTAAGGFRATVYTELFHFALLLIAVVPLMFFVAHQLGGFHRVMASIPPSRFHAWRNLPLFAPHAVMDRFGLVLGLGLVLSFGYWGTDFVQLQRALAVRRAQNAVYLPLSVGYAKLAFAMLIATTAVAAPLVLSPASLAKNWNATLPELMVHYYKSYWFAFGLMGIAASMISTFSNNVAGFTSAWVQGIYQQWISPHAHDAHYTRMSRITNAVAVLLSIGTAYFALSFHSLMEYIQLIFSTFNAPLIALVALAAIAPRRAAGGGRAGFLFGIACSAVHQALTFTHVLRYGSQMAADFYGAIFSFFTALVCTLWIGSVRAPALRESAVQPHARRAMPDAQPASIVRPPWPAMAAGICLAGLFVVFTILFW